MENVAEYHANLDKTIRVQAFTDAQDNFSRRAQEYEQKISQINSRIGGLEKKVSKGASALREAETLLATMDRLDPNAAASARRKILIVIQATLRELETP